MSFLTTSATLAAAALVTAYGIGQFTTRTLHTEIEINAPASAVWDELTDTDSFQDWNPFVTHLSGDLIVGSRLSATIQPDGGKPMDFTPTVLVADADQELRWVGRLGVRGIFDGEHYFVLEQTENGTTLLRHGENFSGMLAAVVFAMVGEDTENGFRAMNTALKARVEDKA